MSYDLGKADKRKKKTTEKLHADLTWETGYTGA